MEVLDITGEMTSYHWIYWYKVTQKVGLGHTSGIISKVKHEREYCYQRGFV